MLWGLLFFSAIASSSTGGNVAGAGQGITTGSSYTESNVTTVVNGSDSGGTSVVDVQTNTNGVVRHEHIERPIRSGSNIIVVATSSSVNASTTGGISITTSTGTLPDIVPAIHKSLGLFFIRGHASGSTSSSMFASTTHEIKAVSKGIFSNVTHFFGHLWGIFGF